MKKIMLLATLTLIAVLSGCVNKSTITDAIALASAPFVLA